MGAGRGLLLGRGSGGEGGKNGTGQRRTAALGHVVVTGGEPMLLPDLVPLCAELRRRGMHVTIETAGTRYQPVECDLMAVSPKLSNSTPHADEAPEWIDLHERNRAAPDVLRRLNAEYDCQFKFVVDSLADCEEVIAFWPIFPRSIAAGSCSCPWARNRRNWPPRPVAGALLPEHGLTFVRGGTSSGSAAAGGRKSPNVGGEIWSANFASTNGTESLR